jgi:hypothetical protein
MYEAPNQISLNWIMSVQTKAFFAKSSYEICTVLRYYAEEWELLTYVSGQPIGSILKVKKSKRENIAGPKLTDIIFFLWDFLHHLIFFF